MNEKPESVTDERLDAMEREIGTLKRTLIRLLSQNNESLLFSAKLAAGEFDEASELLVQLKERSHSIAQDLGYEVDDDN